MIILLTLCCHLFLNVRGEESHFNHPLSVQSKGVLVSGLPSSSNVSEADFLLKFRDNIVDVDGKLASWNTTEIPNVCNWVGVECEYSGHVSTLNLSGMGLSGAIPSSVGSLQFLTSFILSSNNFYGEIPASLGNCSSLRTLDLGFNHFVGTIPANLGRLHKLLALRLEANNLTGPIPSSIYNISTLENLDLQFNLLSGEISPDIGLLRNLTFLALDGNNFTGSIPSSIGNFSLLETLRVGGAVLVGCLGFGGPDSPLASGWLTGRIPIEIGSLRNLKELQIYRTRCTGTIPAELGNLEKLNTMVIFYNVYLTRSVIPSSFGNLTNLDTLFLLGNNFQGNIPPWIGNLVNVQRLNLQSNNLTGKVLPHIGNMTSAGSLLFSANSLSGPVPPELGKLARLTELGLDQNWFSGHLPINLGNLSILSSLFLYQNNLSGNILPAILGELPHLDLAILHSNQFSGPIPRDIGKLGALYSLDLSFNQLSGPIPPEIGQCVALTTLDLSHNHISGQLPICSLESLQSLENFIVNDNLLDGPVPSFNNTLKIVSVNYARNKGLCGLLFRKNCSHLLPAKEGCHGLKFGCHPEWIYIIVGVSTASMAILAYLCLLAWNLLRRRSFAIQKRIGHKTLGDKFSNVNLFIQDFLVTMEELWAATDGFSKENILGIGGSSTVYKAMLVSQNNRLIAVKCVNLNTMGTRGRRWDLQNELKMLGSLRHRNLVRLYGICATSTFKALLMELVPGSSLQIHLHSSDE